MSAVPCDERLLAAIEAALGGVTLDGEAVPVERDRGLPLTEEDAPRLVVCRDQDSVDQTAWSGTDCWSLMVAVVGYVIEAPEPDGDDREAARRQAEASTRRLVATLRAQVHQRLASGDPPGDLALCQDIIPLGAPPPDRLGLWSAHPGAAFTALFDLRFDTPTGDLFTFV
ncbi:hypothetical protein ACIU1J_32370 [Azospirillum doebereinerae]|uniref:hypothetical protein n=1 Tax=Azospirillum doebereinerae TaxID=92933 RepID=UPI001EE52309|nr:hypothetical protein [Azospirillum doebereinerae]MCG5243969.1 hypothetical protein [Azospirillum doebereinerae]